MAEYFAVRIMTGKLEYSYVISKKPELKEGIDAVLIENGREDLIVS